ncbi:MAG TPA: hypothetical protein VGT44_09035 [Ktedonobacteraceae bacterium]|nr:hypothetical protein [Ktedonobacteraceae bacterium]
MTLNYSGGEYPGLSPAWLALAFVGISCLYLIAVSRGFHLSRSMSPSQSTSWLLLPLLGALLMGGALLFLPIVFSQDIQSYLDASQAGARYYAYPPAGFRPASSPALYGPPWLAITSLLVNLSNHNPFLLTLLMRAIELLAHLANTVLIWTILTSIAPLQRLASTLLYAWNPLVLLELVGNAHYDGLVICLLLFSICLYLRRPPSLSAKQPDHVNDTHLATQSGRDNECSQPESVTNCHPERSEGSHSPGAEILRCAQDDKAGFDSEHSLSRPYDIIALVLVGLAISLNWLALVVAPLLLWFMARSQRGTGSIIKGFSWRVLLVLVVVVITYLPIWQGGTTFVAIVSTIHLQIALNSMLALFVTPLNALYTLLFTRSHITTPSFAPVDPTSAANLSIVTSALFTFLLLYLREMGKARKVEALFTGLCIVMLAYVALASTIFWPWLLIWIVWLVALRPYDTLSKTLLLFSCTALLYYPLKAAPFALLAPLCIFGIPFVYFIGTRIWTTKTKYEATQ